MQKHKDDCLDMSRMVRPQHATMLRGTSPLHRLLGCVYPPFPGCRLDMFPRTRNTLYDIAFSRPSCA